MAFDLASAKPVSAGFDLASAKPVGAKPAETSPELREVALDEPSPHLTAAGGALGSIGEGVGQKREHVVGWLAEKLGNLIGSGIDRPDLAAKNKEEIATRLKGVDEEVRANAGARQALGEQHPLTRITGAGTDIGLGFTMPMVRAAEGVTAAGRIANQALTGGLYSQTSPITSEKGDFATEAAKQGIVGTALGGGFGTAVETPGVISTVKNFFKRAPKEAPPRPVGEGAEKVTGELQGIREKIEGKVAAKTGRAEEESRRILDDSQSQFDREMGGATSALEQARAAPGADPRMTGTQFGAVTREAMAARKAEFEATRESEAMPLLHHALDSGAEVNVASIPKQIDAMLKNEKNPDIVRSLLKAKAMMYSKESGSKVDDLIARVQAAKPGTPEYHALTKELREIGSGGGDNGPKLDTTMRGLDSARLAIRSMMSGSGSDPADKFAAQQLQSVVANLEKALEKASPEYGMYLAKYRDLSKPLEAFSLTSGEGRRAGSTLQKDQYGGDFMSSPESAGPRFLKAGPEGAAAARDFKTSGGDPKALEAYVREQLKNLPPDKWGGFLAKHEPALQELGLFGPLKSQEQAALGAAERLALTETKGKEALKGAKDSAAAVTAKAAGTQKNVAEVVDQGVLGSLTTDFGRLQGIDAHKAMNSVFSGATPERHMKQLVSMTKGNPEAAEGVRLAYKDWLVQRSASGEIKTDALLTRWRDSKDAVQKSGLFDAEHFKNVDDLMQQLQGRYKSTKAYTQAGNILGWVVGGGYKTAFLGRKIGGELSATVERDIERKIVDRVLDDPNAARLLNSPATPENQEMTQQLLKSLTIEESRRQTAPQPKRRLNPMSMRPAGL